MSNDFTIRQARVSDLDALAQFGALLAAQHKGYDASRFLSPSEQEYRAFLAQYVDATTALLTVAEDREGLLGYAFVRWEPSSFVDLADEAPWLHDLFVAQRGRGRGIGRALLKAIETAVRERGAKRLRLEVSPQNTVALGVFTSSGFRTTMLEMQKDLTDGTQQS